MAGTVPGGAPIQPWYAPISEGIRDARGAAGDMWRNYLDMKEANTINADRYFHCKGNCEASERGAVGKLAAEYISDLREIQNLLEGDTAMDRAYDQYANSLGRSSPTRSDFRSCEASCEPFAPRALSAKYRKTR